MDNIYTTTYTSITSLEEFEKRFPEAKGKHDSNCNFVITSDGLGLVKVTKTNMLIASYGDLPEDYNGHDDLKLLSLLENNFKLPIEKRVDEFKSYYEREEDYKKKARRMDIKYKITVTIFLLFVLLCFIIVLYLNERII